jgi:DNA primase
MSRIRQEDIEAVKERTDIVGLVSQYLALKKTGHDSMSGLCPFHQEKTASFSVSPSKGVFYCFGCQKGGDAITFLRELESLSYVESVERLAQLAGVTLRFEGDSAAERRAAQRRNSLFTANEEAAKLYSRMLLDGREAEDARAYVEERGVSAESIEAFGIGYAPGYPDFLLRRLAKDLGPEVLLEAGLATKGEDGVVRDRFRGRLTFPVQDLQGRYLGFGARVLPSDARAAEQAKYLNTAETPIYKKGDILYNLHRARQAVSRSGQVFVVEGYTDVIGLAQAGIDSAVATCGTALGEGHFKLMSRFATRAVLAFDSDAAGARAAERAFAFQEQYPVQAVVMIMPDGLDPAEFVAKHGAEAVRDAAKAARPMVEYMVRRTVERHDLSNVEGQSAAVADALPMLQKLQDPVRRSEYGHLLADLTGVSEDSVRTALQRRLGGHPEQIAKTLKRLSARDRVEREMLRLLTQDRAVFEEYAPKLTDEHVRTAAGRVALAALREVSGDLGALAGADDPKVAAAASALAVEPIEGEATPEYAAHVFARLHEFVLKQQSDEIRIRLQKMNPQIDPDYDGLFQQLVEIDGELRRIRQGLLDAD